MPDDFPDQFDYRNVLPEGIRSRQVEDVNGLTLHLLEAGKPDRPVLLLLHGFPELAWSWRKIMAPLASLGYHVVAPDQRGYGRTTGWQSDYDTALEPFSPLSLVLDVLSLCSALEIDQVHAVIGHDFGSPVAGWCALTRPDVFSRVVLMSAPFAGPPGITRRSQAAVRAPRDLHSELAALDPPRKHYQHYYSSREANKALLEAPAGLQQFLRAYYHVKSADWPGNEPHPLSSADAAALAELPDYYVMQLGETMPQTVARHAPDAAASAACSWLPDSALAVYVSEFGRTGFQGGLNWYRAVATGRPAQQLFAGRTIDQPSAFIAGAQDWGIHQTPGSYERMRTSTLKDLRATNLIAGAGHWVQQEQPEAVVAALTDFLSRS